MTDHKRFKNTIESQSAIVQKKRTVVRQSFPLLEFVCFLDISTPPPPKKKQKKLKTSHYIFPSYRFIAGRFTEPPVCDLWIKASLVTESGPELKSKA